MKTVLLQLPESPPRFKRVKPKKVAPKTDVDPAMMQTQLESAGESETITRVFKILDPEGIHMRPAGDINKKLKTEGLDVRLFVEAYHSSVMGGLKIVPPQESEIEDQLSFQLFPVLEGDFMRFRAEGKDARQFLDWMYMEDEGEGLEFENAKVMIADDENELNALEIKHVEREKKIITTVLKIINPTGMSRIKWFPINTTAGNMDVKIHLDAIDDEGVTRIPEEKSLISDESFENPSFSFGNVIKIRVEGAKAQKFIDWLTCAGDGVGFQVDKHKIFDIDDQHEFNKEIEASPSAPKRDAFIMLPLLFAVIASVFVTALIFSPMFGISISKEVIQQAFAFLGITLISVPLMIVGRRSIGQDSPDDKSPAEKLRDMLISGELNARLRKQEPYENDILLTGLEMLAELYPSVYQLITLDSGKQKTELVRQTVAAISTARGDITSLSAYKTDILITGLVDMLEKLDAFCKDESAHKKDESSPVYLLLEALIRNIGANQYSIMLAGNEEFSKRLDRRKQAIDREQRSTARPLTFRSWLDKQTWVKTRHRSAVSHQDTGFIVPRTHYTKKGGRKHLYPKLMSDSYPMMWQVSESVNRIMHSQVAEQTLLEEVKETVASITDKITEKESGLLPGLRNLATLDKAEIDDFAQVLEAVLEQMGEVHQKAKLIASFYLKMGLGLLRKGNTAESKTALLRAVKLIDIRITQLQSSKNALYLYISTQLNTAVARRNQELKSLMTGIKNAVSKNKDTVLNREYITAVSGQRIAIGRALSLSGQSYWMREPDLYKVREALFGMRAGLSDLSDTGKQQLKAYADYIIKRCEDSTKMWDIIHAYREKSISANPITFDDRHELFKLAFNEYADQNKIARGSPEDMRLYAMCFLAIFIPTKGDESPTLQLPITNKAFKAGLDHLRIIDTQDFLFLVGGKKKTLKDDTHRVVDALTENTYPALDDKTRHNIVYAISRDYDLDSDDEALLRKMARLIRRGVGPAFSDDAAFAPRHGAQTADYLRKQRHITEIAQTLRHITHQQIFDAGITELLRFIREEVNYDDLKEKAEMILLSVLCVRPGMFHGKYIERTFACVNEALHSIENTESIDFIIETAYGALLRTKNKEFFDAVIKLIVKRLRDCVDTGLRIRLLYMLTHLCGKSRHLLSSEINEFISEAVAAQLLQIINDRITFDKKEIPLCIDLLGMLSASKADILILKKLLPGKVSYLGIGRAKITTKTYIAIAAILQRVSVSMDTLTDIQNIFAFSDAFNMKRTLELILEKVDRITIAHMQTITEKELSRLRSAITGLVSLRLIDPEFYELYRAKIDRVVFMIEFLTRNENYGVCLGSAISLLEIGYVDKQATSHLHRLALRAEQHNKDDKSQAIIDNIQEVRVLNSIRKAEIAAEQYAGIYDKKERNVFDDDSSADRDSEESAADETAEKPELATKYKISGAALGALVLIPWLTIKLGIIGIPVAIAVSAIMLLPGYAVHELGHWLGGDFVKQNVKEMRAGPIASLILASLTALSLIATFIFIPNSNIVGVPVSAILLSAFLNYFTHIFADEQSLFGSGVSTAEIEEEPTRTRDEFKEKSLFSIDGVKGYVFNMPEQALYKSDEKILFAASENTWVDSIDKKDTDEHERIIDEIVKSIKVAADKYIIENRDGRKPVVAMVSYFTTKEGADLAKDVYIKVLEAAVQKAKEMYPDIEIVGPGSLQIDAAIMPGVFTGKTKADKLPAAFPPNVFIYPTLTALDAVMDIVSFTESHKPGRTTADEIAIEYISGVERIAAGKKARIVMPESYNPEVLKAVDRFLKNNLGEVVLLGKKKELERIARKHNISINGATIINPEERIFGIDGKVNEEVVFRYVPYYLKANRLDNTENNIRTAKGVIRRGLRIESRRNMFFGACLVAEGVEADCLGAGKVYDSDDVFMAVKLLIGTQDEVRTPSGDYLMIYPGVGHEGKLMVADMASEICPDTNKLADIAINTARDVKKYIKPDQVKVAFILDGTTESEKVKAAILRASETLKDEAFVASKPMGIKQALEEGYNALILPDLTSANAAYKAFQRLAGFIGLAIVTGGAYKPVLDISRGADSEEIYTSMILACCGKETLFEKFVDTQKWETMRSHERIAWMTKVIQTVIKDPDFNTYDSINEAFQWLTLIAENINEDAVCKAHAKYLSGLLRSRFDYTPVSSSFKKADMGTFEEIHFNVVPDNLKTGEMGQFQDCMEQLALLLEHQDIGKDGIVRQDILIRAASKEEFERKVVEYNEIIDKFYGEKNIGPSPSFIFQPPDAYNSVAMEFSIIKTKPEHDIKMDHKKQTVKYKGDDYTVNYVVLRENDSKWVYAGGITVSDRFDAIDRQSECAFKIFEQILEREDLEFSDIVRQWNYIQKIVDYVEIDGVTKQRYQVFNDIRGDYYGKADFTINGYPAATGIGQDLGGVVIGFTAFKTTREDAVVVPLLNPLQISAHAYSKGKLVGPSKSTPKFERAKAVVRDGFARIFVSGTASIRGEKTVFIGDVAGQTITTIENIEELISEQNLLDRGVIGGATLEDLSLIRVYVKFAEDMLTVQNICKEKFGDIPIQYVVADVCRPDLLVEIEAIGTVAAEIDTTFATRKELGAGKEELKIMDHIFKALNIESYEGMPSDQLEWEKSELKYNFDVGSILVGALDEESLRTIFDVPADDEITGKLHVICCGEAPVALALEYEEGDVRILDLMAYYEDIDISLKKDILREIIDIFEHNNALNVVNINTPYVYILTTINGKVDVSTERQKVPDYYDKDGVQIIKVPALPGVHKALHWQSEIAARAAIHFARPGMKVLVVGTGIGLDAVMAAKNGAHVDAIDIRRISVENTKLYASLVTSKRVPIENNINAFTNDLFEGLDEYDLIIFNMPIEQEWDRHITGTTTNVTDINGNIKKRTAETIRGHLSKNGIAVLVNSEFSSGVSEQNADGSYAFQGTFNEYLTYKTEMDLATSFFGVEGTAMAYILSKNQYLQQIYNSIEIPKLNPEDINYMAPVDEVVRIENAERIVIAVRSLIHGTATPVLRYLMGAIKYTEILANQNADSKAATRLLVKFLERLRALHTAVVNVTQVEKRIPRPGEQLLWTNELENIYNQSFEIIQILKALEYRDNNLVIKLMTDIRTILQNRVSLAKGTLLKESIILEDMMTETISDIEGIKADGANQNLDLSVIDKVNISGDSASLKNVIANIIENARQSADRAFKEINARVQRTGITPPQSRMPMINVALEHVKGMAEIRVSDNGFGILDDVLRTGIHGLPRMFDSNVSEGKFGTGLGLAEARSVIALHGGTIEVSSKRGRGATFTIRLPIIENSIIIGVSGFTEKELRLINSDFESVLLVSIDETVEQEESLKQLQNYAKQIGALDIGIIEGVKGMEGLRKAVDNLIDGIEEDRIRRFLVNPENVELSDETIETLGEKLINLAAGLKIIRSQRLADLSIYEYKFTRIANMRPIKAENMNALSKEMIKIKNAKYVSLRADNAAELGWAINEHRKTKNQYSKYPVKLHIRLSNDFQGRLTSKGINRDNLSDLLEKMGTAIEELEKEGIVIRWNDSDDLSDIKGDIKEVFNLEEVSSSNIAVGDVRDVTVSDEKDVEGLLFVKMDQGLISQQYQIIVQLIANDNKAPDVLPENVEQLDELENKIHGVKYFVFKAIVPVDMQELQRDIERYETILIAA